MTSNNSMRVVSGIQPTGDLHLGNLLGAILRWVRMQDEAQCLFFLADLHALTVDVDPARLQRQCPRNGGGADRQRHRSRQVDPVRPKRGPGPCRARLDPQLHRPDGLAQPDDPVQGEVGQEPRGRLASACSPIPCCRRPTCCSTRRPTCPVGEDQKQHIELARDIALKFNNDFDVELFIAPEPYIGGGTAARVMSLRDGSAKMSKSDPSEQSRIHLTDSDDAIAQKIRKAKTDPEPLARRSGAARPAARGEEPGRDHGGDDRRNARSGAAALCRPGLRRVQAGAGRCRDRPARAACASG